MRPRKSIDVLVVLAHHEAGHAVLSAAINEAPQLVSIAEDATSLGHTTQRMVARPSALAQVYLAGFAAEHLLTGRRPRQLDQEIGFSMLARQDPKLLEAFNGSEQHDGHRAVTEVLRFANPRSDSETFSEINRLYDASRESLSSVWTVVRRVAGALAEAGSLNRDQLFAVIGCFDIYGPVSAVQAREESPSVRLMRARSPVR
ncbi:MAG: hypothetical protein WDO69_11805 [Pseudomonadota bacterium]